MNRRHFLCASLPLLAHSRAAAAERRPNIVYMYADDLGYGDASCYGATRVRTPNLDRAAAAGVRFTNAHSSSATCTPSRHSLLTGEYAWRHQGTGVLPGNASLIIHPALHSPRHAQRGRIPDRRRGQVASRPGRARPGLERRHCPRSPRSRLRLLVHFPCYRRPRPLRFRGEPPRGQPRPQRSHPRGLRPSVPRRTHRRRQSRTPQNAAQPRPRQHHRQRHQPDRLHDRRQIGAVGRRGYGRHHHRQGRVVFGTKPRAPVFPLLRHSRYPCATRAAPAFRRQDRDGPARRRHSRAGLVHWPRSRCLGPPQAHPRHTLHFLQRQRSRRGRWLSRPGGREAGRSQTGWAAARRQIQRLRRRHACAVRGPLARHRQAGCFGGGAQPGGPALQFCRARRLQTARRCCARQLQPAACPAGQIQGGHIVEHATSLSLIVGDWKVIQAHIGPKRNQTGNEIGNDPQPQLFNLVTDLAEQNNVAAQYPDKVKDMLAMLAQIQNDGRSRPR